MITEEYYLELESRRNETPERLLRFTSEELKSFSPQDVAAIIDYFQGQALMLLPKTEIAFFEWVKEEDPPVWTELWEGEAPLYSVSIAFLRSFTGEAFGFPIADLIDNTNYYFHKEFIIDVEKENLIADILKQIRESSPLSMPHLFILEIWLHPTDAWRFAYKYDFAVKDVKDMIDLLAEQGVVLHKPKRDEFSEFVEW